MYNYPFKSVVSITTDGAPSMMGRGRGLVALLKEDQTDLISYHYIIHQSVQFFVAICAESMLWSWQQWWNFLRASLSLQHRLLRGFLTEVIANYDDLVLHNNVRWHSKGRALERFWAIGRRSQQKSDKATQFLEDVEKMQTAAVLADITSNPNELNFSCRDRTTQYVIW